MPPSKKILLLSPYDAISHKYWREGLVSEFSEHKFIVVTLPARFFSWRFRGNSLTMAHDDRLADDYDLLIATSMTDLSALKGMCPNLARVPCLLYFHENQFAYPQNSGSSRSTELHSNETATQRTLEMQITSIYSAIAANQLVFNSRYNKNTFLEGAELLLQKMPDHVPVGICQSLADKSLVIPVPLGGDCFQTPDRCGKFSILWNHRWEFDKGLDELRAIVCGLIDSGEDFTFHLAGQQFKSVQPVMNEIIDLLRGSERLGNSCFVESREDYLKLLARSNCVLSTSNHEFQGLAIQEAIASGCVPIVPDRLVYPEYIQDCWRYNSPADAVALLKRLSAGEVAGFAQPSVDSISWRTLRADWDKLIEGG